MDYKKISQEILANIGGKENIENAAHCCKAQSKMIIFSI